MLDLLVVGEALIDVYCVIDGRPRPIDELGPLERHLGGAPTNFAVGCRRSGARVGLVTRVGDDPHGRLLLRLLRAEGVDTTRVRSGVGKTGMSMVSVSETGERSFDFYGSPSADMHIEPADLGERTGARVLHFGSNTLIIDPGRAATLQAIAMARTEGAVVSCDLNVRRYRWPDEATLRAALQLAVSRCDWLKVSDEELVYITGALPIDEAATALLAMGPSLVAITCGADGAHLYTKEEKVSHASLARAIVDTTGCGDAFWAGCVTTLLQHTRLDTAALTRAVSAGSTQAARCIAKIGAV